MRMGKVTNFWSVHKYKYCTGKVGNSFIFYRKIELKGGQ